MITKEEFVKYIEAYQNFENYTDRFDMSITGKSYPSILFETDWFDAVDKMLDTFLNSHFTDSGVDWIYYYLFEDVKDKAAYVKRDKDIFNKEEELKYPLTTLDELWDFILTDKELYFKNV